MRPTSLLGSVCITAIGFTLVAGAPSASAAGCATTCSVGGAGTGGESSEGRAGGFRIQQPSTGFPGATYSNSGNEIAGNISLKGTAEGMGAGAITPQGAVVGHYDGIVAVFFGFDGTCNGVCG